MDENDKRLASLKEALTDAWQKLDIDQKLRFISELEEEVSDPEIWKDPENAKNKNTELARLSDEVSPWKLLKAQCDDLHDFIEISKTDHENMDEEISDQLAAMEENFLNLKKELRFTGKYDSKDAILRITAGVGGTEAMDWAGMLERMYLRYFERNNYSTKLIERVEGEEAGIKTAVYEVHGTNTYGNLKSEHGVHRLVRLSPFNADNLRQTSFALVEVLPELSNDDLQINEADLKIDYYRSGGHGGQSVNTTYSAVRITHLPTNTTVAVQNERSQIKNKAIAMSILRAKLDELKQQQQVDDLAKLRAGESASWGKQIRNYVLHPYTMVKDTRTKHESTDVEAVLDGEIGDFIEAYLEAKSPSPAV